MWWGGECSIFVSLAPVDRQHHKSLYHTSQKKKPKEGFCPGRDDTQLPKSHERYIYLQWSEIFTWRATILITWILLPTVQNWFLFHSISLLLKLSLCSSVFSGTVAPLGSYRFFGLVCVAFPSHWQVASRQTWQMWHMLSLVKWIWAPCLLPLTTVLNVNMPSSIMGLTSFH